MNFENPLTGVSPFVVKTKSFGPIIGMSPSTAWAAFETGTK